MITPRLRMFAGPNGSGKTTLLRSLAAEHILPLGFNLNPDDVDRALARDQFTFADWGVTVDHLQLRAFCRDHPLGAKINVDQLSVEGGRLRLTAPHVPGYLAAVLSDYLRQRWVADQVSFTYETVMSSSDKVDLAGVRPPGRLSNLHLLRLY